MKIYLSGKVTELTEQEYTANFERAELVVVEAGNEPVNPIKVDLVRCAGVEECGGTGAIHHWTCYMKHDIVDMLHCDAVAVLPNWFQSKGARIEVQLADSLQMPLFAIDREYKVLHEWRNHV